MPALTIKNIPDELYEAIKAVAETHHRSINSEVIMHLRRSFLPQPLDATEKLTLVRRVRANVPADKVHFADIEAAKAEGRP